jgi:hypothetical protein
MDDADLDIARAQLLEATGRISEAADVHMAEGEGYVIHNLLSLPGLYQVDLCKHSRSC